MIKEPTHILNTSSSYIDLIFTSLPNLIFDSGVHSSLHPNCHHQIVYAKFNLEIIYSPPYLQEVWHYKDSNIEIIQRAMSVNEKVDIFNNTFLNILSNFIPHKILTYDKDPPWFNKRINGIIPGKKQRC